ncbi:DNA mismatch repair protein MutT, partial [Bacillus sp. OA1]|nr:DNA mismatch repair protein MutT [Bacillus sp. OA1]
MEHKTPKHIVAVAGYLIKEKNEVLLVKVHWRADTWELPG